MQQPAGMFTQAPPAVPLPTHEQHSTHQRPQPLVLSLQLLDLQAHHAMGHQEGGRGMGSRPVVSVTRPVAAARAPAPKGHDC